MTTRHLLALAILLTPTSAFAADDPPAPAPDPSVTAEAAAEPADWSFGIGVGIGVGSVYVIGGSGLGALGGLSVTPEMLVERRLAGPVWLLFRVSATHSRSAVEGSDESTSTSVGGDVGVRYVFNPDDRFQVSGWITLGGHWTDFDNVALQSSTSANFAGRLGVSLDRELIEGLFLRLGLRLLSAGYSFTETEFDSGITADPNTLTSAGAFASLDIRPSLELRYTF